jgi:hypothetical protein
MRTGFKWAIGCGCASILLLGSAVADGKWAHYKDGGKVSGQITQVTETLQDDEAVRSTILVKFDETGRSEVIPVPDIRKFAIRQKVECNKHLAIGGVFGDERRRDNTHDNCEPQAAAPAAS